MSLSALERQVVECRRCPRLVEWREQVAGIERVMREELAGTARLAGVREVRTLAGVAVIETTAPSRSFTVKAG